MEVAPDFDLNGITALLGANVLAETLAAIAGRRLDREHEKVGVV